LTSASIRIDHPDYAQPSSTWSADQAIEELKRQTLICVLRPAVAITGRVTTFEGKPLEGATLAVGHFPDDEGPFFKTDKDGRYEIRRAFAGDILTVVNRGWAPAQVTLPGGDPGSELPLFSPFDTDKKTETCPDQVIDFTLRKGHRVEFEVVDTLGKPVNGVYIVPDDWRGNRALLILRQFIMSETTDANGKWVWEGVPSGESLKLDFFKSGFMDVRDYELKVSKDMKITQVFKRPQILTGTVLDAATKRPIEEFVVQKGFYTVPEDRDDESGKTWWPESDGIRYRSGKYRREISMPTQSGFYRFRIHATGYEVSESGPIPVQEGVYPLNFELKRSSEIKGLPEP
jgi:hypothetical protein